MDLHTVARGSGLVGGLCWLARLVLDLNGAGTGGAAQTLYWIGLSLLAVALAAMGAGLVSSSATWLRVIVGLALPLLVWSVLEILHPAGDPEVVDGVFAGVLAVVAGVGLVRARAQHEEHRSAGTHAR